MASPSISILMLLLIITPPASSTALCDAELLTVDLTLAVKPKTSLPNGFVVTPSNSTLSSTGTVVSLMVRSRFLPPPPATDGC